MPISRQKPRFSEQVVVAIKKRVSFNIKIQNVDGILIPFEVYQLFTCFTKSVSVGAAQIINVIILDIKVSERSNSWPDLNLRRHPAEY